MQINVKYDLVAGIIFTFFGAYLIIFRKWIALSAVKWNRRLWHFSATERQYRILFVLGGIIFTISGLLYLFGTLGTPLT